MGQEWGVLWRGEFVFRAQITAQTLKRPTLLSIASGQRFKSPRWSVEQVYEMAARKENLNRTTRRKIG